MFDGLATQIESVKSVGPGTQIGSDRIEIGSSHPEPYPTSGVPCLTDLLPNLRVSRVLGLAPKTAGYLF